MANWNSTEILDAIPLTSSGKLHKCLVFTENNDTSTCSKWVFDTTYRASSRGMEWNLVCRNYWKGALVQSFYMLGVFAGAIILGGLADKIGRKTVFCWSALLQLLFGVLVAFIPEYWIFSAFTFLYGMFGSAGAFIPAFVLTMEIVGPSKRTKCSVAFHCCFSFGMMCVAVWGAIISDKTILQVVYGLHSLILIPHLWIMDESPRWLYGQGRVKDAVQIVQKALKFNKSDIVLDTAEYVSKAKAERFFQKKTTVAKTKAGTLELFKTPHIRNMSIIMCICWFANSLVYYGLTLSSGKMEGNPYIIIAVFSLVDIPSYLMVFYFLDIWGRRLFISIAMLIGGTACVIAAFLPEGATVTTVIIVIGKLFIAASFAIAYNYSCELFPTVVRNTALGLGSMFARLSGALTPLITLLESFDAKIPAITFGVFALVSGFLCMFLPETMNKPLPESIEDGENFGKGDTLFSTCFRKKAKKPYTGDEDEEATQSMVVNSAAVSS
ncbi:unnamed protein product [Pieris macdunnoughi]|uniref:Major facilitator superfamily (MFS) profile domain-containing protein n=2 Tax=Pieris macdunnoughi TaxID=345717 RepID=A0A821S7M2_9NEOP|nr:unnamed protein product [Pieris macdunnoughi]